MGSMLNALMERSVVCAALMERSVVCDAGERAAELRSWSTRLAVEAPQVGSIAAADCVSLLPGKHTEDLMHMQRSS